MSESYEIEIDGVKEEDLINGLDIRQEEAAYTVEILSYLADALDDPGFEKPVFVGSSVSEEPSEFRVESDIDVVYWMESENDLDDVGKAVEEVLSGRDGVKNIDSGYEGSGGIGFFEPPYIVSFDSDIGREYELTLRDAKYR